jgi:hypothetical protein
MGEVHSEDGEYIKNIMGFAEAKLIKNCGNCMKHLIWLRIFKGKS